MFQAVNPPLLPLVGVGVGGLTGTYAEASNHFKEAGAFGRCNFCRLDSAIDSDRSKLGNQRNCPLPGLPLGNGSLDFNFLVEIKWRFPLG